MYDGKCIPEKSLKWPILPKYINKNIQFEYVGWTNASYNRKPGGRDVTLAFARTEWS